MKFGYTFFYENSYVYYSSDFEDWRVGPTGLGPATLSINEGSGIDKSFTSSISGSYPVGIAGINLLLGVFINESQEHGTSYSISIPSGQRKTIIYRPKYVTYKVFQRFYQKDTWTGKKTLINTSIAYVTKFSTWDYSWKYGY